VCVWLALLALRGWAGRAHAGFRPRGALPGRPKTDKLDSAWLAKVTGRGSVAGSFVPPEDIRRLRTRTRYRRRLTQARTAEKQRAEKLLEDAHLKLSSVISDIHGVSGRDMLRALAAGERDPRVLAEMARGVMRRKLAFDQQAGTHRQARGHIRSLERLGYKVTLEPVDPDTGELTAKAG
jgi:transposase